MADEKLTMTLDTGNGENGRQRASRSRGFTRLRDNERLGAVGGGELRPERLERV